MGIPFLEIGPFIFIRTHYQYQYQEFIRVLFDYCYCDEFATEGIPSIW